MSQNFLLFRDKLHELVATKCLPIVINKPNKNWMATALVDHLRFNNEVKGRFSRGLEQPHFVQVSKQDQDRQTHVMSVGSYPITSVNI